MAGKFLYITLLGLLVTISCTKETRLFGWVRSGTNLYYDYYTPVDTITDLSNLFIAHRFDEQDPSGSSSYELMFRILDRDLKVNDDGLYGVACENCGWGIVTCMEKFNFLYAPNDPVLIQEIPEFSCGRTPSTYKNKIIEIDKSVIVPYGTFETYVMLHFNGDRSYWNPENGLIMYDRYDQDGNFIGSLKLNRVVR